MNDHRSAWTELLACPACHGGLCERDQAYFCETCNRLYPIIDGTVRFSAPDEFYEGKYVVAPAGYSPDESSLLGKTWLYYYSQHYLWYIRRHIPRGAHILDVAGGSGIRYLSQHWHVAGLEISTPHAQAMARNYELALCADALHLPFQHHCLDAVISRFFLEHVPRNEKIKLLEEFRRVLRPGGWVITLQDCDCDNPLWRWAKHNPELYRAQFVENDGHFGLMYPSENLDLFRQSGFEVLAYHGANKTPFVTLPMIEWMQPYRDRSTVANILLGAGHAIYRNRWLTHAYTTAMTMWDDIGERLLPLDHARYLLAVCRRGE